jgi:hypothetical protein
MENLNQEYDNLISSRKGRPNTTNIKMDEQYFKKYYHYSKHDVVCECGATVSNHCLLKHTKRPRHTRAMELKMKLNNC